MTVITSRCASILIRNRAWLRMKKSLRFFFQYCIHLQSLTARRPGPDGHACAMHNLIIYDRAVLAHRSAISEPNDRKFLLIAFTEKLADFRISFSN
ncbi:Chorismate synthase [Trichinella pseudospiralis]